MLFLVATDDVVVRADDDVVENASLLPTIKATPANRTLVFRAVNTIFDFWLGCSLVTVLAVL
jgi:hypothetical protein